MATMDALFTLDLRCILCQLCYRITSVLKFRSEPERNVSAMIECLMPVHDDDGK